MYIFLILFFVSLLAILIMIGNKLVLLRNGEVLTTEEVQEKVYNLEDVKHSTIRNIKKYGRVALVSIIRFYVRSSNFLKSKYQEVVSKIKSRTNPANIGNGSVEKNEVSKFLKMMSEYKHKIRNIKEEVKEEENS